MSGLPEFTSLSGLLAGSYDLAPFPTEIWTHIAQLSPHALDLRRQLSLVNKSLRQVFLPSVFESVIIHYNYRRPPPDFDERMTFLSSDTICGAIRRCWFKTQNPVTRRKFDFSEQPIFVLIAHNLRQVGFESITFRLGHIHALSTLRNIQSIKFVDCDISQTIPTDPAPLTLSVPRLHVESMMIGKFSQFCFWAFNPDDILSLAYSRRRGISACYSTELDPKSHFPNLQVLRTDPAEVHGWWRYDSPKVILPALTFLDFWYAGHAAWTNHMSTISSWRQQPSLPSLRALSCGPLPPDWIRTFVLESMISHLRITLQDPFAALRLLRLLVDDSRPPHLTALSLEFSSLLQPMKPLIARLGERGITSLELRFIDALQPQQLKETFQALLNPDLDTEQHVLPTSLKSCYLDFRVDVSKYLKILRPLVSNSSWSTSHPELGILCIVRKAECESLCYDHQLGKEIVDIRPSWLGEMAAELGIEHLIDTEG